MQGVSTLTTSFERRLPATWMTLIDQYVLLDSLEYAMLRILKRKSTQKYNLHILFIPLKILQILNHWCICSTSERQTTCQCPTVKCWGYSTDGLMIQTESPHRDLTGIWTHFEYLTVRLRFKLSFMDLKQKSITSVVLISQPNFSKGWQ